MRLNQAELSLSATDLSNFLGCRHRTALDLAVAYGTRPRMPRPQNPTLELLYARGLEHERRYVELLKSQGRDVLDLSEFWKDRPVHIDKTLEAMRVGADVIVQGALADGRWFGLPDILNRIEKPSDLGSWSYEIADTKLARETRAGTVLQLGLYSDMLSQVQGLSPEFFHVITPDPVSPHHTYRIQDYAAYFRWIRARMQESVGRGAEELLAAHYPEPVDHCDICPWWTRCRDRWRTDDHLSLVAGITRLQRRELEANGIATLADLASMPLPLNFKPRRGSKDGFARVREQARLQFQSRGKDVPDHELRRVVKGMGLHRLPEPSPGDLFLDLEGDFFAAEGGREYLFGIAAMGEDGAATYRSFWGFTEHDERAAFESVMDLITETVAVHPEMHVYHYAPYEPSAFKRLMGRYVTREEELDGMLRSGRFVDLYQVVRQALVAGIERYSIKNLEVFYGFGREVELREASRNLHVLEQALEFGSSKLIPQEVLAAVEGYNRDDCVSTAKLRDWLESLRRQAVAAGEDIPRPPIGEEAPPPELDEKAKRVDELRKLLLDGLPELAAERTPEQQARWLVAYMLDFHRREAKAVWWEYYRLCDLPEEDLFDEPDALAGLEFVARIDVVRRKSGSPTGSVIDRYSYPPQEMEIELGDSLNVSRERPTRTEPAGEKKPSAGAVTFGTVVSLDKAARTIDIRKGPKMAEAHPTALFEFSFVPSGAQETALLTLGERIVSAGIGGLGPCPAADLLLRNPPRLKGEPFVGSDSTDRVAYAVRAVTALDNSLLCIQGPPGSGKTYAAGRMIRALLAAGLRVGVTANSHKVIRNLLEAVATSPGPAIRMVHVKGEAWTTDTGCTVDAPTGYDVPLDLLQAGEVGLVGGTAWLWARSEFADSVDVLFVDEAGQMSLPNVLAISSAGKNLVLLGDPQQLDQPQKGSHPDGVNVSALAHMLGDHQTLPPELGLFFEKTWRLHPDICAFTSEMFYESRLLPVAGLERQELLSSVVPADTRLWYVEADHDGNTNSSVEEVAIVESLVRQLLASGSEWIDRDGSRRPLEASGILIVAPYNAQVSRLLERLGDTSVRIGTVDKFQGQEAPIVIYSSATSRPEDAPRGMDFLYSPNRLNVATSRAKCVAFVVASPLLFEPDCRTPKQMKLANPFCRFRELANTFSLTQ